MQDLTLSTYIADAGPIVITLGGELTLHNARALRDELLAACAGYRTHVVLDVTTLRSCDAAGLNTLLAAHQHAARAGGSMTLVGHRQSVAKALRVTDLDRYFAVFPSKAAAFARRCSENSQQQRALTPTRTTSTG